MDNEFEDDDYEGSGFIWGFVFAMLIAVLTGGIIWATVELMKACSPLWN